MRWRLVAVLFVFGICAGADLSSAQSSEVENLRAQLAKAQADLAKAHATVGQAVQLAAALQKRNAALIEQSNSLRKSLTEEVKRTDALRNVVREKDRQLTTDRFQTERLRTVVEELRAEVQTLLAFRIYPWVLRRVQIKGRIQSIDADVAVTTVGTNDRVRKGLAFAVYRRVATFTADRVEANRTTGRLTDSKEKVKVGDVVLAPYPVAESPPGTEPATGPSSAERGPRPIQARIKAVQEGKVTISTGARDGVTKGLKFLVFRDNTLLAVLVVDEVKDEEASGRLVDVKGEVCVGDNALANPRLF
jgi:hypothetical protein